MPRQNAVTLSKQASFAIDCEIYGANDGDRQAIMSASTFDVKRWAKICGCITCAGYLQNIKDCVEFRAIETTSMVSRMANSSVRYNRRYFIQKLREAIASQFIKHNFENFNKEI